MLPNKISFVDVETTGMSSQYGKIIEIGIIRVENNIIVDQFSSLINPQTVVDPFIQTMTGITAEQLEDAPTFYDVADKIREILSDSLFIAHNVLFDYSFIKREFERLEETFNSKYCCSVKLSKNLYPRFKHHNLDSIIKRFNFECKNRHRALDDAKVIWDFYKASLEKFGEEKLLEVFKRLLKRPTLPANISADTLESIPDTTGIYIFYNKDNIPLYIGKSKNIRTRVLSHFSSSKNKNLDMKISQNIDRVEVRETAGELGALLLEATLVKKMQPLYNRQLRYAFKLMALKKIVTDQNYNSIEIEILQNISVEELINVLGIFKSAKELKRYLLSVAKEYHLCPKLLGLEKTNKNCFNFHLGLCKGACDGKEHFLKYNLRFDEAFFKTKIKRWPFKGPIGIKERSQKEEVFIVDKWCVLGSLKNNSESLDDITRDYLFDTDTYKILSRYLNHHKNFEIFNL